jgi:hypothetical protein
MIDIVKLANGNVAIYDNSSGDFINSLSPDIVEIECNVNGSVKVVQDNGSVEYIDPATVANTEVVPAAPIAFSGDCADLAQLLSTDFFFVVSGGGASDLATVLGIGNSANNGIIDIDYLDFDTAAAHTVVEGELAWNNTDGTLDLGLKGGNVTLQIGQEEVIRVVNKTSANLLQSDYKVVRIRTASEGGSQGQRLAVLLAQANTKANHSGILGLVTENITNNQEGFITTFGYVRGIDTTGSLQSETWADGDALWLSETVAGGITNIEPANHPVQLGWVTYAHAVNGKIFVKVQEGVDELGELHDVSITSAANGNFLEYNGTLWVNRGIVYTVELMDALTVDFYAPYDLKINSTTNIKNAPTITIQDDGAAYTLTNTIAVGSKITVTASIAGVTNLNITKA